MSEDGGYSTRCKFVRAFGHERRTCMSRENGDPDILLVHATAVALGGIGVLLRGDSGAGKSDLALRLIDEGGRLIADDQVLLRREKDAIVADVPHTIAGMLEVRGLGIVRLPHGPAPLGLLVDLQAAQDIERLPLPEADIVLGVTLPVVRIDPLAASAPARVRLSLAALVSGRAPLAGAADPDHSEPD